MDFDSFMGQVQHRARLAGTDEALRATRATLTTLAERLSGGAATNIGAQLPQEVKEFMADSGDPQTFGLDEFYGRVSEKEQADYPDAVHHARSVLSVVVDAVGKNILDKERQQLPEEFSELFASAGELRGS